MKKSIFFTVVIIMLIVFGSLTICIVNTNKGYKYKDNPIIGNQSTGSLFDPNVMIDNEGTYRMYVSWRDKKSIAVTTSKDGIHWGDLEIVLTNDLNSGWEDDVNRATVIYNDGKYQMWYTGQSNNISKIGYAVSDDGFVFEKYNEPIIVPEFDFENMSVMNPHVIYDSNDKIYKMWYAAGETYEPDCISYATSNDGIHWQKYKDNPILEKNEDKTALDSYKIGGCEVHKTDDGQYIMFYIGYTDINTARIFIAKSRDGITNWERSGKPIIEPDKGNFDQDACYKPSALYNKKDNKLMIWYNGRTGGREYIGLFFFDRYETQFD